MARVRLAHLYNRGRRSRMPSHQPNMSNCASLHTVKSPNPNHTIQHLSTLVPSIEFENFPLLVVSLLLSLNVRH